MALMTLFSAGLPTLASAQTDRHLAGRELTSSPLYRELLVSPNLDTTALLVCLLGWRRWEVTVISANFISLQLILTLSLVIHPIWREEKR